MKLAIAQMVLGAIIVGNYIASVVATSATFTDEGYRLIYFPWFNVCLVLGLAVLGCGIAQFLKAMDSEMRELIERCVKDFMVTV